MYTVTCKVFGNVYTSPPKTITEALALAKVYMDNGLKWIEIVAV
jgi:hypothetical protein